MTTLVVNLDHNATTQPCPESIEAVRRALEDDWENPSSPHRGGQRVKAAVELARKDVAALVSGRPNELVFTSGGTESICLAVRGVLAATKRRVVVTSSVEHAAVAALVRDLEEQGILEARWVPVDSDGVVDVDKLVSMLDGDVALVSVQWSNNEVGAVQPVGRIGRACRERGIPFHCDGTPWVGKMPADMGPPEARDEWTEVSDEDADAGAMIDLLTLSAHKFHGPKGIGALWVCPGIRCRAQAIGSQELGRRGGTENVPGILGMAAAAREAMKWLEDPANRERQERVRDRFQEAVVEHVPDAVVNGTGARRIWNTCSIAFPGVSNESLVMMLSERGVYTSAGSACSSGSREPSPVLKAMGVPEDLALGTLRFSISKQTTVEEVEQGAKEIGACVAQLRQTATA